MRRKPVTDRFCLNPGCPLHGQLGHGEHRAPRLHPTQARQALQVQPHCLWLCVPGNCKTISAQRIERPFDDSGCRTHPDEFVGGTRGLERSNPGFLNRPGFALFH